MLKIYKHLFTRKKSKGINRKKYIILHHTGSDGSLDSVANYLANNSAPRSAHYVIGQNGDIVQIENDNAILWHAGESSWGKETNLNISSIGIEVHSNGSDFTDAQRKVVKTLIEHLMAKYGIPNANVLRHRDIAPRRKSDIGNNFWNNSFATYSNYILSLHPKMQFPNVSEWAEDSVRYCFDNGIIKNWDNPQEIVGTTTLAHIFKNLGMITKVEEGGITKEQFSVVAAKIHQNLTK